MAIQSPLSVGDAVAEPGAVSYGTMPALELADGTQVDYPVILVGGAEPGPTVFVGAGVHGDEITGIEATHRLVRAVDASQLAGNLVVFPIQNPLAVSMQHRVALQLITKSPMDQMPGDPWMVFPGKADGNTFQRMAAQLFGVMSSCDAVIDIHTPTTGGRYLPFIFPPPRSAGAAAAEKARAMALAWGPHFILDTEVGVYVMPTSPNAVLAAHGVPAFGFETGEGGKLEEDLADDVVRGVLNVLRHLEMQPGELEGGREPVMVKAFTEVRCSRGGFLHPTLELGADVRKGDVMATVTDRYGRTVEEVPAPHDGPLLRSTTFATVASGERIGQLGLLA